MNTSQKGMQNTFHKIDTITYTAQSAVDDAMQRMRIATDKLIIAMQHESDKRKRR